MELEDILKTLGDCTLKAYNISNEKTQVMKGLSFFKIFKMKTSKPYRIVKFFSIFKLKNSRSMFLEVF
jgi:hypothetical protein